MKYLSSQASKQKGFTLVEMIVSIAIFTIVAVIAVGALLKIVDANKKAQSLKTTINNVNFLFEAISREMRVGSRYRCAPSFPSALPAQELTPTACDLSFAPNSTWLNWSLAFHSSKTYPKAGGGTCNLVHIYHFSFILVDGTRTLESINKHIQPNCENWSTDQWSPGRVTSSDIIFTHARLKVDTDSGVGQPKVFLRMKGYSGTKERNQTPFDIQTTISQRIDD